MVGIPTPGGVQGTPWCGTHCSGWGDKMGITHRLDSMILEVFSTLSGSMILKWKQTWPAGQALSENSFVQFSDCCSLDMWFPGNAGSREPDRSLGFFYLQGKKGRDFKNFLFKLTFHFPTSASCSGGTFGFSVRNSKVKNAIFILSSWDVFWLKARTCITPLSIGCYFYFTSSALK